MDYKGFVSFRPYKERCGILQPSAVSPDFGRIEKLGKQQLRDLPKILP